MYIPTMYRCPLSATGDSSWLPRIRCLDGLELQAEGKFLNQSGLRGLFLFAEDEKPRRDRLTANTLSEPRLLHYYLEAEKDWE